MNQISMINDAQTLLNIETKKLIHRFTIQGKHKTRIVNDPIPPLKTILKNWNKYITQYYVEQLKNNDVENIAHAYLPFKSITTNANCHLQSPIIQFDFRHFYDSCEFKYFKNHLKTLDSNITTQNEYMIKRLLIDPYTNGITQGLPVSGALAGLTLIPFWKEMKHKLPSNIVFTQYSDDLTFSYTKDKPDIFNINDLTHIIYQSLNKTGLKFELNPKKTRIEKNQFRKITGVRLNHLNQTTPSRKDYRFLRHALFVLSESDNLEKELAQWQFDSKESFVGKISYIRSIDSTNKINKLIKQYEPTCKKHDIFTTWL